MYAVARAIERHSSGMSGCCGDDESIGGSGGGGPGEEQHPHRGVAVEDVKVFLVH